jgi:hypothetical protein
MSKRTYEVSGGHAVRGNEPGSTFSADLTDAQEQFYLKGGHLKRVTHSGEKSASHSGGDTKEK